MISCNNLDNGIEGFPSVSTKYNLCVTKVDGSGFQDLGESYPAKFMFFIQNDTKLLLLNNDKLRIIDLTNFNNVKEISLNFTNIVQAEISPNQEYLALSAATNTNMDIHLINLSNNEILNLTNTPGQVENYPSFSHDNATIIYATYPEEAGITDQTISVYDLPNKRSEVLIKKPDPKDVWTPIFNYPQFGQGDSLIYYINHTLNAGIFDSLFAFSIKDSGSKFLYSNLSYLGPMKVSSNSETAIFITNDYPNHLISFDLDNDQAKYIDDLPEWDFDYSISKDGSKLAYVITVQKNKLDNQTVNQYYDYELWITNNNGTDNKLLSNGIKPIFSSDGSEIAFYKTTNQIESY